MEIQKKINIFMNLVMPFGFAFVAILFAMKELFYREIIFYLLGIALFVLTCFYAQIYFYIIKED